MATNSKIEWCDSTFNPWIGCTKVSQGCANCYAAMQDKFRKWTLEGWGAGKPRKRTSVANWREPLKWNREYDEAETRRAEALLCAPPGSVLPEYPRRPRVFCASLADWLDVEVPTQWRVDLLDLIEATPNLDWLLLTKRPEGWSARMHEAMAAGSKLARSWLNGNAPSNVWVGTTVEDQTRAEDRIPELIDIPAKVRFLSCEPLLGPVDLRLVNDQRVVIQRNFVPGIHWVICGGESGPGARPFVVEYADDLRRQCERAGVAFFMKQFGALPTTTNANLLDWPDETVFEALPGELAAGARILFVDRKGGDIAEFPEQLQVRQFPEVKP